MAVAMVVRQQRRQVTGENKSQSSGTKSIRSHRQ
ncbi:unnamed protein product [Arabidopsis halleri]